MCFHLVSFLNFSAAENAQSLSVDTTVFTNIVYVHVFIWIHFRKRFHIAAVLTLSVLGVDRRPNQTVRGFKQERSTVDRALGNICRTANPFRLVLLGLAIYRAYKVYKRYVSQIESPIF